MQPSAAPRRPPQVELYKRQYDSAVDREKDPAVLSVRASVVSRVYRLSVVAGYDVRQRKEAG